MGKELAKIETFRAELAKAETFEEIKYLKSQAEAVAEFAKRLKIGKAKQDEIGVFLIEVGSKQGEWLDRHFPSRVNTNKRAGTEDVPAQTIKDIGVTKNQSSQSRLIAKEPELVQKAIETIKASDNQVVTPNAVVTEIKKIKQEEKKIKFEKNKNQFAKEITETNTNLFNICFNGNCIELMQNKDLQKCSLLLSDPPYGMDFKSGHVDKNKWDRISNDKIIDTISILDNSFNEAKKHLLPDAHIYIFGNPNEIENIKPIFCKYFNLKNILIWDREVIGMGDLKTYGRSYDIIYFGYNEVWKDLNGIRDRDILRFERVSPSNLTHPTEKPLSILEYLIKKSTNENEFILDPFAGSCSTLKSAKNLNRNSYGFELELKYIPNDYRNR
jgi:site-specific DNA-methyltransferase (adenine-specific)